MERLISLSVGYLFGIFQTGYIIGKFKNIDIRTVGSGNAGSSNVLRMMGWRAALLTFVGDVSKCVVAILLVRYIFRESDILPLLSMYAGLGATLGHDFPFYMGFKGGKGIAVLSGIALMTGISFIPIPLAAFLTASVLTRFVSLGSLLAVTMFFLETMIFGKFGQFGMAKPQVYELYAVVFAITLLAWYLHKSNIQRMLNGKEIKIEADKKENG